MIQFATDTQRNKKNTAKKMLFLCAMLLLNLAGTLIATLARLPLYINTVGTVCASVLGGYMPGVLVGFVTCLIRGASMDYSLYYSVVHLFCALFFAFAAKRLRGCSFWKLMLWIPLLALLSSTMDAVLTWFLNGFAIGGIHEAQANALVSAWGVSPFWGEWLADFLLELVDKAIVVTVAVLILQGFFLGKADMMSFKGWRQTPLSSQTEKEVRCQKCRTFSVRTQILLGFLIASISIAAVATVISFVLFKRSTIQEHTKLAEGLAGLAAETIDANRVDDYIENGEAASGYLETEQALYTLKNSAADIEYLYAYKIMDDGCHVVFDLDTEDVEASSPGDVLEFDESFLPLLPALLAGEPIDPIVSDDSFGWLLTVYQPVYDDKGVCQCYAAVDISMNLLSAYGTEFLTKLISLLVCFFIFTLVIFMWLIDYRILIPINTMAYCADAFAFNSEEEREENVENIHKLAIHTGDEVENLYLTFQKMVTDTMRYVSDIQTKTDTIAKMQSGLIMVLADMVESRDQCTGDHVRKTAAYTKVIMEEMKRRGFYEDKLTDSFIQDVVNAAPLHDIGKIHVSDTILNKPGKLTDEEFEIMKSHTTFGGEIIEKAIQTVPDSGYLKEAENMAQCHHEKWNGTGYPHGLSGEAIPLSARIMAVADVFDALVSTRSYKKPFTFEKATEIIKEGAGTHFDPKVAEAFIGAEEKVKKIAAQFEGFN